MAEENDNGGIYFLLGVLLVAVLGIGIYVMNNQDNSPDLINTTERTIERTVENNNNAPSIAPAAGDQAAPSITD